MILFFFSFFLWNAGENPAQSRFTVETLIKVRSVKVTDFMSELQYSDVLFIF